MKLHVLATGTARGKDLSKYHALPEFRKATANMVKCTAALESILEKFPNLEGAAMILGSSYGELAVTTEFIKTLETQGIARPLLFQNSLHNATLGFLAIRLGITGPSMTLSHRHFTGENCLEAASLLLSSGTPLCYVLSVESRVTELGPAMRQNYPSPVELGEGAAALLLASEETVRALGVRSLAVIESVECSPDSSGGLSGSYYDSDALERIADAIQAATQGGVLPRELKLRKPDRSCSTLVLSPA
jgi:3-oxoacyl-(acyl-carrier-protein) synthase